MKKPCLINLEQLLAEQGETLRAAWLDQILALYPKAWGDFIQGQCDPFANPAGAILREGIERIFAVIIEGAGMELYREILKPMIRLKAVQDLPPSQALAFLPLLKTIIRSKLDRYFQDGTLRELALAFDMRIDTMGLLAFDVYLECRETIYQLRVNEMKRNVSRLLARPDQRTMLPSNSLPGEDSAPGPPKGGNGSC